MLSILLIRVRTSRVAEVKSPSWVRALQIGFGIIAIVLSSVAIIFPIITILTTLTIAAIIMFLFGIESVIAGIFIFKRSRAAHIGLGILVIILATIVMAYPLGAAVFLTALAGVTLLFSGIAGIVAGLFGMGQRPNNTPSMGERIFSIAAGAVAVGLSIMIIASPLFGLALAAIVIGIGILIYGIRLVVTGVVGRGQALVPPESGLE